MTNELREQIIKQVEKNHPMPYSITDHVSEEDLAYFADAGLNACIEKKDGVIKEVMLMLS